MTAPRNATWDRDERGAIMVIAVFMAVFLVGLLYYVVGVGQAILQRERLQDAADAAALASSVVHARGMNFIVLLNIVMAALMTILVALKVVETLTLIGIAVAAGAAFFTGGASLAIIPPLKVVQSSVDTAFNELKPPIFTVLEILHDGADALVDLTPRFAEPVARSQISAPTAVAVLTPRAERLPVDDDAFDRLCEQAGVYTGEVAMLPLKNVGLSVAAGPIEGALGKLARSFSDWFCGDSGGGPPAHEEEVLVTYPKAPENCQAAKSGAGEDYVSDLARANDATNDECRRAEELERLARPDDQGECVESCEMEGPYEQRAKDALAQCNPKNGKHRSYMYQLRKGVVTYTWSRETGWQRGPPTYDAPVLMNRIVSDSERSDELPKRIPKVNPPCGHEHATIAPEYNLDVHPDDDPSHFVPVCSNERPPPLLGRWEQQSGRTQEIRFSEVTHIFACVRYEKSSFTVEGDPLGGASDNSKAPKAVGKGLEMGDEAFQIRTFLEGHRERSSADAGVRLPLWKSTLPESPLLGEPWKGRLAFAQAEFFYDGKGGRGAWMWNMNWRGRLRVMRVPRSERGAFREAVFAQANPEIGNRILTVVSEYADLISH